MANDLHALVRERCAAKIQEGKRPSKADLEWLEATREAAVPYSSAEGARNSKGDMQFGGKFYAPDPLVAEKLLVEYLNRMRAKYPMRDGTVGSPMVDDAVKATK